MGPIKKKRMTRQRAAIYNALCSTDIHPSADWIYNQVKQEIPEISLGTVYRNLQVLKEDGNIIELSFDHGQSHFDANVHPHGHFVCNSCGRILDFSVEQMINTDALDQAPGDVNSLRIECFGVCKDCLCR